MTIEKNLNNTLDYLLSEYQDNLINTDQLIESIDLTLLDEHATNATLTQLLHQATATNIAAVCVYLKHLHYFQQEKTFKRTTVVNFPFGDNDLDTHFKYIDEAINLGANEIDYVFPYQTYMTKNEDKALRQCDLVIQYCNKHQLTLKIILETGAFPDIQTVYQVCRELINLKCSFLKTSTGKIAKGACLDSAFAILSAIKDSQQQCGIKISGGIKTVRQAQNYAFLAQLMIGKKIDNSWFRIGASSLLDELIKQKDQTSVRTFVK